MQKHDTNVIKTGNSLGMRLCSEYASQCWPHS